MKTLTMSEFRASPGERIIDVAEKALARVTAKQKPRKKKRAKAKR